MSIFKTFYKDRPAVAVQSNTLTALFLPGDGGKMASLSDGGQEYLAQTTGEQYKVLTYGGSYVASECSGFDDMFPTIDPYVPNKGMYAGVEYPDHGEVCRVPMETSIDGDELCFKMDSRLFGVTYKKTVSARDEAIVIRYTLENHTGEAFPFIWVAHLMLKGEDDAQIVSPFDADAPVRVMFGPDGTQSLSRTNLAGADSGIPQYKFYYVNPIREGYCAYRYPSRGKELLISYPKEKVPYLGVWINNGDFHSMYNIALEPCTAPYDTPGEAEKASCPSVIDPNGSYEFIFVVRVSSISSI